MPGPELLPGAFQAGPALQATDPNEDSGLISKRKSVLVLDRVQARWIREWLQTQRTVFHF